MQIKKFTVGYLQTNCYVITTSNSDNAVLIDVGGGYDRVKAYLEKIEKKPTIVLLTHGHFDHILDANKWQKDGAKLYIHEEDAITLSGEHSLAKEMRLKLTPTTADVILRDGDEIQLDELNFKVMHTPGHTLGGVCYVLNDEYIFSGDTIFCESYGRTDFYGGDISVLKSSIIDKIFSLEGDYIIHPGHGESTTLRDEKKYNPILFL